MITLYNNFEICKLEKSTFFSERRQNFSALAFFIAERKYKFRIAPAFLAIKKKTPKGVRCSVHVLEVDAKVFLFNTTVSPGYSQLQSSTE